MVYSFLNVNAFIAGPGLVANLAAGAGAAEEGIEIAPVGDKNEMVIGAGGEGQHSLIASNACLVTVRLLKTSPWNAALMLAYDLQSSSSALWGQNVFTLTDTGRGDATIVTGCAFKKKPDLKYASKADILEWQFDGISANTVLGV